MAAVFDSFHHVNFGDLRTAIVGGKILFSVDDVCKPLEYPTVTNALYMLDTEEYDIVGADTFKTFISESGLYTLIVRSSNPLAKEYKRWIRDTVIPELRAKITGNVSQAFAEAIRDNTEELLKLVRQIKDDTSALKNVKISFEEELPF